MESIGAKAKALNESIVALRRELHSHPELEHDLPFTESVVVRELSKLGLDEVKPGQGQGHGVLATLKGKKPGKVLALRADMDALPIREETGLPFASTNGNMHACGHDAHVAMLLTAAKLLADAREELAGTVRFIFQPSEETINGALSMIESGALENPTVDGIIGLHTGNIWDGLEPGQIGWRVGPMMAATSTITIVFEGRGGHGATPHLTVDPIVIAAEAIGQLQTLVSREISPFEPAVLTIGKITGGSAPNVIAGSCELRGTIRSFNPKVDALLKKRICETVEGVAASMRGHATVAFSANIAAVVNDKTCVLKMRDIAAKALGEEWVKEIALPSSGAEDFAFYLAKVPGAFFYHCATFEPSPEGTERNYPHHNSRFDVNESVLWTGSAAMAAYALHWQD
jgi:amidohydrolase